MVDENNFFWYNPQNAGKRYFGKKYFRAWHTTQIAADKCFCSQATVKQSIVFILGVIALKTRLYLIGKFKSIEKMTYNVIK